MPINLRPANEGLTHDKTSWFFSNQHILYKTSKLPIEVTLSKASIPNELKTSRYDHIGDIDVDSEAGVLYAGLESSEDFPGILAAYNTSDFSLLRMKTTSQRGAPWVAVDYSTRLLYSNDWGDRQFLQVYDLDTFDFVRSLPGSYPAEVQGAAFFRGDLYLSSNLNCSVWRVDVSGDVAAAEMVVSDNSKRFFEMEGLTFWEDEDLKASGLGR